MKTIFHIIEKLKANRIDHVSTFHLDNDTIQITFKNLTQDVIDKLKCKFVNADCFKTYNSCVLTLSEQ